MGDVTDADAGGIAPYLGAPILTDSFSDMYQAVHSTGSTVVRTAFQCPADELNGTDPVGEYTPIGISGGPLNIGETTSYGINSSVFGWQDQLSPTGVLGGWRRARGFVPALSHPSDLIVMADLLPIPLWPLQAWGLPEFFYPYQTGTLWDAYQQTLNVPGEFDFVRHKGNMNALFLDGHVETIAMTQGSMSRFFLNKDITSPPTSN